MTARVWRGRDGRVVETPLGRRCEQLQQVAVETRQHDLRLGVAEPAVELEHSRPVVREHQARVEKTDERGSAVGELGQNRSVHGLDDVAPTSEASRSRHRRVRAHPTRVRAGVPVTEPLVVLRCGQCDCPARRRTRRRRTPPRLRAAPRRRRRSPKLAGPLGSATSPLPAFGRRRRPFHAARPSALTTQGARAAREARARSALPRPASPPSRTTSSPRSAPLLALGPKTGTPVRRSASAAPATSGASGPITARSIRSARGQLDEPLDVVGADRVAAAEPRDPGIAWSGVELGERAAHERAGERVLPPARADDEDLHRRESSRRWARSTPRSRARAPDPEAGVETPLSAAGTSRTRHTRAEATRTSAS